MKSWVKSFRKWAAVLLVAAALSPNGAVGVPSAEASAATVVKTVGGDGYMAALKSDGSVWIWGDTGYVAGYYGHPTPTQRGGLPAIQDIAASEGYILALDTAGNVWAWGQGYLGNGVYSTELEPIQVLSDVKKISAGAYHALALKTNNTVVAWGTNYDGQLGVGDNNSTGTPTTVITGTGTLADVADIATGNQSSYAVTVTGAVYAWGENINYQLGTATVGTSSNIAIPISGIGAIPGAKLYSNWISDHAVAVTVEGAVYGWGDQDYLPGSPALISGLPAIDSVATGYEFSLFLDKTGLVWGIGDNGTFQLTKLLENDGVTPVASTSTPKALPLSNVKSIGAGEENGFAVNNDGLVYHWGYGYRGATTVTLEEPTLTPIEETGESLRLKVVDGITGELIVGEDVSVELYGEPGDASPTWDPVNEEYVFSNLADVEHDLSIETYFDELNYKDFYETLSNIAGQLSPKVVEIYPEWYPQEMVLIDEDPREGYIAGYLNTDAMDGVEGSEFSLYFVDVAGKPIGARIAFNTVYPELYVMPTSVPAGAVGLRLKIDTPVVSEPIFTDKWLLLTDDPVNVPKLAFEDRSTSADEIDPYFTWTDPAKTDRYTGYELYLIDGYSYFPSFASTEGGTEEASTTGESSTTFYSMFEDRELLATYPLTPGTPHVYDGDLNDDGVQDIELYGDEAFGIRFVDDAGNYSEMFSLQVYDSVTNETASYYTESESIEENAEDVMFFDRDSDAGEIGGRLVWRPGSDVHGYVVYFVNADGEKVKPYAHIDGLEQFFLDIPLNTPLPPSATGVALFPEQYGLVTYWETGPTLPSAPDYVGFWDTDGRANSIAGYVSIQGLSKATGVAGHEVYFTNGAGAEIGGPIAVVEPNNYKEYHTNYSILIGSMDHSDPLDIPAGATHLGVRAIGADGTTKGDLKEIPFWDDRILPSSFSFVDGDPDAGEIAPILRWRKAPDEDAISLYRYSTDTGGKDHAKGGADALGWYEVSVPWSDFDASNGYLHLSVKDANGAFPTWSGLWSNLADDTSAETALPSYTVSDAVPRVTSLTFHPSDPTTLEAGGVLEWYDASGYDSYYSYSGRYDIFVLNDEKQIVKRIGAVKRVGNQHTYTIPDGAALPLDTRYFAVAKVTDTGARNSVLVDAPIQPNGFRHIEFTDTDLGAGQLRGVIRWMGPADETEIVSYRVSLADIHGAEVQEIQTVAKGSALYSVALPADTAIEEGAVSISILALDADGETIASLHYGFTDAIATPEGTAEYRKLIKDEVGKLFPATDDPKMTINKLIKYLREIEDDLNGDGVADKQDVAFLIDLVEPRLLTP